MGNESLVDKLISKFMKQLDGDMTVLEQSFSDGNGDAVYKTAHRIKGAAANLSMEALREAAALIEAHGRANKLEEASSGFRNLSAEVIRLKQQFNLI